MDTPINMVGRGPTTRSLGETTTTVTMVIWLVVSTHLKNIGQNGNLPHIGMKIKNIWNDQPVFNHRNKSLG